jgi:uroporphyrinogen-III synthase
MGPLAGIGVLVTRPDHQAGHLCKLIEAQGGTAVRLPVIDIRPRPDRAAMRAAVGPIDHYQLIIFVSANAVRFGAELLGPRRDLRLAAIGKATAHALNVAGYRVALLPAEGADTESLLRLPELAHLTQQRVLIVRGVGGRELLGNVLAERGAQVTYAEVYTRERARYPPEEIARLEALWTQGAVRAVTVTSGELLEALLQILTPAGHDLLQETPIVTGARSAVQAVERLGLRSPLVFADGPDDTALVGALVRWHLGNKVPRR